MQYKNGSHIVNASKHNQSHFVACQVHAPHTVITLLSQLSQNQGSKFSHLATIWLESEPISDKSSRIFSLSCDSSLTSSSAIFSVASCTSSLSTTLLTSCSN